MIYTRTCLELFLWSTPELEEICTKPDLLDVGLVTWFCYYLLYCILLLAFFVLSQPDQTEPSPSQQFDFVETVREPIPKSLGLLLAQIIRVTLLLFLPFQLYFLKRWIFPINFLCFFCLQFRCALVLSTGKRGMFRCDFILEKLCFFSWFFTVPCVDFLQLCLFQSTFQLILLTTTWQHLLLGQIQILQTLTYILFKCSFFQPRSMGLMSFPKRIVFAWMRSIIFLMRMIFIPII